MTTFPSLTVFLLCVSYSFSQDIRVDKFHHGSVCNVQERLRLRCSQKLRGVRDSTKCSRKCIDSELCNGVSFNSDGTCYLHKDCPYPFECNGADEHHQHLERHCLHGTWNTVNQSCDCPEGYSGDRCHIHPPRCPTSSQLEETRIFVDPEQNGANPIPVKCSSWNIVNLLQTKGHFSFNRTWEEYKRGFFINEENMWLGLDNWHRLSNAGCNEVKFLLRLSNDATLKTHLVYNGFFMSNEAQSFEFDISGDMQAKTNNMPGDYMIKNCFGGIKHTPFSTWDRDNDGDPGENCAARAGSGWWYLPGCVSDCNVLGLGAQFWNSTPSHQHLYLEGADLASFWNEDSIFKITLENCPLHYVIM